MPAFVEAQFTDTQIANMHAYLSSLPRVAEPAAWRVSPSANASLGEQLAVSSGCAQCHGVDLGVIRQAFGSVGADYARFVRLVYSHTDEMPALATAMGDNTTPIRMGNFNRLRVTEATLQEIWKYLNETGLRARVSAAGTVEATSSGAVYSVTVQNRGLKDKGAAAEGLALSLTIPAGATVVATDGPGYKGVAKNAAGADVATWEIGRLDPADSRKVTITLSATGPITAGTVTWARPAQRTGAPGDQVNIQLPRPQASR
jgi:cytochrome c551/c552